MFSGKFFHNKQIYSTYLFNFVIQKRFPSSRVSNNSISSHKKQKVLNSILKSEIKPFINENKLHFLTPLLRSEKHFKIFYKFVIDYDVAKDIVDKIMPHMSLTKDIIVEANPGLGLITLCLINYNVPKVIILDKSEIKNICLNNLMHNHQERLTLINVNLFKCSGLQITELLEQSLKFKSSSKVIGVITNNTFLINLMYTYVLNELWDIMHYLEFYLVVSSIVWNTIITSAKNDTRYFYHSLFSFMFQFEDLGKYPSDAFFPVPSNDKDSLRLVKITANSKLIESIKKDDLKSYVFFLEILSKSKQTFIIPALENYIPNCGPYLISKGVSMSNIIRDFTPSDSVLLFNIFKECEGYDLFKRLN